MGYRLTPAEGVGQRTITGMIAPRIQTKESFRQRAKARGRMERAKAKESGARQAQLRMKTRHGQKKLLMDRPVQLMMRAMAFGIGMRETQIADGLWMIMMRMKVMMKYR